MTEPTRTPDDLRMQAEVREDSVYVTTPNPGAAASERRERGAAVTPRAKAADMRHRAFERLFASPWSGPALREAIGRFEPRFVNVSRQCPGPHDHWISGGISPWITTPEWVPPPQPDRFYAVMDSAAPR